MTPSEPSDQPVSRDPRSSRGKRARGLRAPEWMKVPEWMKGKVPINKGVLGEHDKKKLPQINNPLTIAALGVGMRAVRSATHNLRPSFRPGRAERFRLRVLRSLQSSAALAEVERFGGFDIRVDVKESFGKPTLVSADLCISERQRKGIQKRLEIEGKEIEESYRVLVRDLLERMVEELWDNPEIAPVAVRGRIVAVPEGHDCAKPESHSSLHFGERHFGERHLGDRHPQKTSGVKVLMDMTNLGFEDEIGRPADLYDTYGAPASDPNWRP